jgi:hypothetical protein
VTFTSESTLSDPDGNGSDISREDLAFFLEGTIDTTDAVLGIARRNLHRHLQDGKISVTQYVDGLGIVTVKVFFITC